MEEGKLYLVPTPIGNLGDITYRAVEILKSADFIAAEDTRQTLKLLNHLDIKKSLISYHQHNENGKSEDLMTKIKEGKIVALVSDAGTPGISDPGAVIVKKCIEENIKFEVLPGATAVTTALVYSGLDTTQFMFKGFVPRETKERKILINDIKDNMETIIMYEAPHRLLSTLTFFRENLGNRNIAACRELTKLHEEIVRGTLDEVIRHFTEKAPRGEFVLVISGKSKEEIANEEKSQWEDMSISDHIIKYIDEGLSKKDAIKKVAKERSLPKNEVYKYSTDI
ncbi:MAG: 16S rRNA (cytidine(1402)-2'-O)-methyltransferase [Clostridium sp.]